MATLIGRGHLKGELVADRYELVRPIGAGGMGEVWEARHRGLDAPVAIKFAVGRRLVDPASIERFGLEARALASLRSPDIVQIYDVGEHDGAPFMVMELLVGETLAARLEREKRLAPRHVLTLLAPVTRALSTMHRAGFVHRDVTPANLFILAASAEFPEPRVRLLDLGIVKNIVQPRSADTTTGSVLGSPAYMSPEQARAEAVDSRSDVWSLAAVAFRCLVGRDPFEGRSTTDVLVAICTADVPRPSELVAELPAALDAVFERAFARNREHRFASVNELLSAFHAALAGDEPAHAGSSAIAARPKSSGWTTASVPLGNGRNSRSFARAFAPLTLIAALIAAGSIGWLARVQATPGPSAPLVRSEIMPAPRASAAPAINVPARELAEAPSIAVVLSAKPSVPRRPATKTSSPNVRTTSSEPASTPPSETVDPMFGLPRKESSRP